MVALDPALVRFRQAYDNLFMLLGNYPVELREEAGACGEWSPRQTLTHLCGWIAEAHKRYSDIAAGDEEDIDYTDIDQFNAQSVQARDHMEWNAIVSELRGLAHDLSLRAAAVPQSLAEADDRYAQWLETLCEDCEHHTQELRTFIETEV